MKVIFLEDMPNVAQAGEIKEVANGYARNYLLPKKLASVVRPGIEKEIAARQAKIEAQLAQMGSKVEGVEINLSARAGSQDRLYGAVTAADIAAEISAVTGLNIDKKRVELDKAIHQLGSYEVNVRLGKDTLPTIKVNVNRAEGEVAEETDETETAAEAEAISEAAGTEVDAETVGDVTAEAGDAVENIETETETEDTAAEAVETEPEPKE
jgi:large subunit ribosomal protein L9